MCKIRSVDAFESAIGKSRISKLSTRRNKTGKFSGQAYVVNHGGANHLISYTTEVARVDADGSFHRTWSGWSVSTARHVRLFVAEYCPAMVGKTGKAAWEAMKVEKVY